MSTMFFPRAIYCIKNQKNGRCYIGSAFDLDKRIYLHFNALRRGKHHCTLLQEDFDASSGINDFKVSVLDHIECFADRYKEKAWQKALKTYLPDYGYNSHDNYWRLSNDNSRGIQSSGDQ